MHIGITKKGSKFSCGEKQVEKVYGEETDKMTRKEEEKGQKEVTVDRRTHVRGGACHVRKGVCFWSLLTFSSKRYCWSNSRE